MQHNKISSKAIIIWIICVIFYLYEFFLRTIIGSFQQSLTSDLQLSATQFSLISSTFFLVIYGVMQIPASIICEKLGLKKALLIGVLSCCISTLGFSYSHSFYSAAIFRILMGFGSSFGIISLLVAINEWLPHRYIAIIIGVSMFIGTMGPMLGAGPLEDIITRFNISWRNVFLYLSIISLLISMLVFAFVRNNTNKSGQYIILYRPESLIKSFKNLFKKSQPWFLSLISATLYFNLEYLSENEGRFFIAHKGISLLSASYMLTMAWVGFALSNPLFGLISDMLQRRKIILQLSSLIGLISIIAIIYSLDKTILYCAFLGLGISSGGIVISTATISEQFKKEFVAIGFGLNNAILNLFSGLNAPLISYILHLNKSYYISGLTPYFITFNTLLAVSIIALLISSFFIKETYCKSQASWTYL